MRNEKDSLSDTLKDYRMALNKSKTRVKHKVDFLALGREFKRINIERKNILANKELFHKTSTVVITNMMQ